jgi:glycosyltransferase involved in cell wall biosynthesis
MRVSVIIPAFNAEKTIEACLRACREQTYEDLELLLVDDGSTDRTAEIAANCGVWCIRQTNQGPADARNRGAAETGGEVIAFTDADCVPRKDWVERLVAGFGGDTRIVGVGGTYDIANPESRLARIVHEEIVTRHRQFKSEVDFLGSFNVAYRREPFEKAGGFDTSFRAASGEDNDLAYRLHDAGGRLRFVPEAVVAHYHPEHLAPYLRAQQRHGYWRMKLYGKHRGRAKTGDQYAPLGELMTIPVSLVLVASGLLLAPAILSGVGVAFFVSVCIGSCLYLALAHAGRAATLAHLPYAARMAYVGLAILRDVARGIGMLRGLRAFKPWRNGESA